VDDMMAIQSAAAGHVGLARLEPSDRQPLRRFFFRLSPETIYRRFHSPIVRPEQAQPDRLLDLDNHDREAVAAVVDDEIIGVARYVRRAGTDTAEVAVVVADAWQRQGLATRMLGVLGELARAAGVRQFNLEMQADNTAVLRLVRRFYPDAAMAHTSGMCEAVVSIARPEL
jgi:RimJ/RimL family protein N-acetyltransferase